MSVLCSLDVESSPLRLVYRGIPVLVRRADKELPQEVVSRQKLEILDSRIRVWHSEYRKLPLLLILATANHNTTRLPETDIFHVDCQNHLHTSAARRSHESRATVPMYVRKIMKALNAPLLRPGIQSAVQDYTQLLTSVAHTQLYQLSSESGTATNLRSLGQCEEGVLQHRKRSLNRSQLGI